MPLFTLPFEDDDPLFCVSFHPEKSEFAVGLATGRVSYYKYDADSEDATPERVWSTKRHKGSCRAIGFSQTGAEVVSCGSEGIVKKCAAASGKVTHKASISAGATALAINEDYVVVGDDGGSVHALKLSDLTLHRKYALPDRDAVTAICPLAAVNRHNFAVGADMHVLRIDVRKDEVLSTSEDQEDEILCGCVASETRSAWGMSEGVVTIWNNRGLSDQQQRVRLTKDGSVDAMLAGEHDNQAVAGTSEGLVYEIDLVAAKVLRRARHGDEVSYLDYDYAYRLVSGSMSLLKVWLPTEFAAESAELDAVKPTKSAKRGAKGDKKSSKKAKPAEAFADLMG